MTILEEIKNFLKSILYWIYSLFGFSFFFFTSGFSVQVFQKIQSDLLPPDVHLVVTNPMSAFVSQILLSLLLAFIITFPLFLYKIMQYLSPALFKHEKKLIFQSLLPAILLFFSGCSFAYYFLIPATFKILYPYAVVIGAVPFFSVNEFVSSVLGLMIATGIMFLLPLFMVILSFIGLVKSAIWRNKWRYALLFFLIFTAIITPDGTGITMALLFFPMAGLYFTGCILTSRFDRSKISA